MQSNLEIKSPKENIYIIKICFGKRILSFLKLPII